MTPEPTSPPGCPACAAPLHSGRAGKILGGVPTEAEIELTRLPGEERAERSAARPPSNDGPLRCDACGESLHRMGSLVLKHRGAAPVLTMAMAADRLRNHLRRRAIVRPGRIEGDCYLLPFVRFEGGTPEGDDTFTLLAASIGEERLEAPFLLPADLRPFEAPREGAAGGSGAGLAPVRILPPTLTEETLRDRAGSRGWRATKSLELIHYPFWLMRVEDCGRIEGAWMDGIEGKMLHHRLLLPATIPSGRRVVSCAAASAIAAGALAVVSPPLAVAAVIAVWAASAPLFHAAILRSWRG